MGIGSQHKTQELSTAVWLLRALPLALEFACLQEALVGSVMFHFFFNSFGSWKFDSGFSLFPVGFVALFLLMIRPHQLFSWWRSPQLILACLVFQEVLFFLFLSVPLLLSSLTEIYQSHSRQEIHFFTKTYSTASYFLLFQYFPVVQLRRKSASSLESFVNLSNAGFVLQ